MNVRLSTAFAAVAPWVGAYFAWKWTLEATNGWLALLAGAVVLFGLGILLDGLDQG